VVTGPVGAPVIRWITHISINPRGRPQGPLAPQTTTNLGDPFPHRAGTAVALPSSEAGPSGSGTLPELKSPCGNRLLRRFAHLFAPSSKAEHPGHGTRRSGLASEWFEAEGEWREGTWTTGEGLALEEVTKWNSMRRRTRSGDDGQSSLARSSARISDEELRWRSGVCSEG
jgi:hypothetical protein